MNIRTGLGYDIHKLAKGRKLFIGGVEIPFTNGLEGHSDGDVLLHAICDALLGAIGRGDIGEHFPNTDKKYKDISSKMPLNFKFGISTMLNEIFIFALDGNIPIDNKFKIRW